VKKYRNPNIPKPTPSPDGNNTEERRITKPVEPRNKRKGPKVPAKITPKPKPKKASPKNMGNVFIPDFSKPKGNRLRFLNQLNEMNKKAGY
jgi:hypothetical protein